MADVSTKFMAMRTLVGLLPEGDRILLANAIATEEAARHGDGPAYYAWNRVGHAVTEAVAIGQEQDQACAVVKSQGTG